LGGGSRDVLIGGRGADMLIGNFADDLLISGYTAFDADQEALYAIMAEWASSRDYAARVVNLRGGGGLNGAVVLDTEGDDRTVFDDEAADQLVGAAGRDWFFAQLDENGVLDRVTLLASEVSEIL